jgi:hypothetical protein
MLIPRTVTPSVLMGTPAIASAPGNLSDSRMVIPPSRSVSQTRITRPSFIVIWNPRVSD